MGGEETVTKLDGLSHRLGGAEVVPLPLEPKLNEPGAPGGLVDAAGMGIALGDQTLDRRLSQTMTATMARIARMTSNQ
jgi:hypothetical protein